MANSASIISLVPEILATIPQTPVLAAGGIVDAGGIVAALTLGAEGVVIGTRFAASSESAMADGAKLVILNARDGGASTKRYMAQGRPNLGLAYMMFSEGRIGWQRMMEGLSLMILCKTMRTGSLKMNCRQIIMLLSEKRITKDSSYMLVQDAVSLIRVRTLLTFLTSCMCNSLKRSK